MAELKRLRESTKDGTSKKEQAGVGVDVDIEVDIDFGVDFGVDVDVDVIIYMILLNYNRY